MVKRSQRQPWVQVIGQIAVRLPGRPTRPLAGASRVLLAMLVAAGTEGAPIDTLADAFWRNERPDSWEVALRVAASHLAAQLPEGWRVDVTDNRFRLVPADGFVDAWRVTDEADAVNSNVPMPRWLARGRPFDGIRGIPAIDDAADRLARLLAANLVSSPSPTTGPATLTRRVEADLRRRMRLSRRAIVTVPIGLRSRVADIAIADDHTQSHLVIGDRGLLLPVGPFAVAFPAVRATATLEQGVVPSGEADLAFRAVSDTLAREAGVRPQQLIITRADELDPTSLRVVEMLIERAPQTDFSLAVIGNRRHSDVRWLDFVSRAQTAGCDLIDVAP